MIESEQEFSVSIDVSKGVVGFETDAEDKIAIPEWMRGVIFEVRLSRVGFAVPVEVKLSYNVIDVQSRFVVDEDLKVYRVTLPLIGNSLLVFAFRPFVAVKSGLLVCVVRARVQF
jgi:hypothetical protein